MGKALPATLLVLALVAALIYFTYQGVQFIRHALEDHRQQERDETPWAVYIEPDSAGTTIVSVERRFGHEILGRTIVRTLHPMDGTDEIVNAEFDAAILANVYNENLKSRKKK